MKQFLTRYADRVIGVLSGFDRLVFRGTLRQLAHVSGFMSYLSYKSILLKELGGRTQQWTEQIRTASEQRARAAGRPLHYLASSQIRKDEYAAGLLRQYPVEHGLIAVLKCVEPCQSYEVHRCRRTQRLELRPRLRKGLHLYHYFLDPHFGLVGTRLQTWVPFGVQIWLNGREWLIRQLEAANLAYARADNCVLWVADVAAAQALLTAQVRTHWPTLLERICAAIHPAHATLFGAELRYYWSTYQVEWATDVLFRDAASLAAVYGPLSRHAITQFGSRDVMRFFSRRLTPAFRGELVSDYRQRREGVRVKHWIKGNSLKLYDKQARALRVETTFNQPQEFKTFRAPEGRPQAAKTWRRVRKSVADLRRLTEIGQATNARYLDALATLDLDTPLRTVVATVTRPTRWRGRRVRALQPCGEPDRTLLALLRRGEFLLHGFRNRDLRALLPAPGATPRAHAARIGRLLRVLRAHKLITRLRHSHSYRLTKHGRRLVTAITAAENASVQALVRLAA